MTERPHGSPRKTHSGEATGALRRSPWLAALLVVLTTATVVSARPGGSVHGRFGTLQVRSFHEIRRDDVVVQQLDYSCGAAALLTLLRADGSDPISEPDLVKALLATGNAKKIIARGGFSLLDLRRYVRSIGLDALGHRVPLNELLELEGPLLVPLKLHGRMHYVVLWEVAGRRAVLSDPAFGRITLTLPEFRRVWETLETEKGPRGLAFQLTTRDGQPRKLGRARGGPPPAFVDGQRLRSLAPDPCGRIPGIGRDW
ncbi:MAG: cysteine peptidase family C39 domain-containing protein [Acidobacteriota bacterium]